MTWLLDGNILVALAIDTHVHHVAAHAWFAKPEVASFATCAVTQGTLLRVHMRLAVDRSARAAWETLARVVRHPAHLFWPDALSFVDVPHFHLQGAKQVTDAWLAELARRRRSRLATLDAGLALLHRDVAELIRG